MSLQLVFVTGMSGAGITTSLKMLEDMGYFCIDNLPVSLIDKFVQLSLEGEQGKIDRVAMGVDIRSGEMLSELPSLFDSLREQKIDLRILFLDADETTLVKRFKETRRAHPLAGGGRVAEGIRRERVELQFLKEAADYILDTSQLLTRELRAELEKIFLQNENFQSLMITVLSFGYKYGIPQDADLVFDVRFLPNPYYVQELRPLTGRDQAVRDFVWKYDVSGIFADKLEDLIRFLIPHYIEEGKNQLIIGIGCTGGKHRSVVVAEELFHRLGQSGGYGLRIEHRDMEKDTVRRRA